MPTRETRITVESTANPSVLFLNTSYLYRNKFGILKSIIFVLSLVIFILLLLFKAPIADKWTYLLCINFCHLYIISLMTACCLFSLTTATLMTKLTFDFVFHIMAFLLYLIAGIWICLQDLNNDEMNTKIIAAFTLIVSFIHLAHSVLSYKTVI